MSNKKTTKKMGRPRLPKGAAKGKIVPVRFNDTDLKRFSKQAKVQEQTLSDWVRDGLKLWDDRLDDHGIDAIVWQGASQGDDHRKTLAIIFKEIQDGRRFTVDLDLIANAEHNRYSTPVIPAELEQRGIDDAWVTTTKVPFIRSEIYLRINGVREPISIMKRY